MSEQKDIARLRSELVNCAAAALHIKFYDETGDDEIELRCNDLASRLRDMADSLSTKVDGRIGPKVVQLLTMPDDGTLIALGSDGVTYVCGTSGRWEPLIRPLGYDD